MTTFRRLDPETAREISSRAAAYLASQPEVRAVFLFGSAVSAEAEPRDVDLAIQTCGSIEPERLEQMRSETAKVAGGPIDLVFLNEAPVVLAHEVAETGRCLFARDPDAEVEFVTRARARYWDFKPFLEEQWRASGERLEERRRGPQT